MTRKDRSTPSPDPDFALGAGREGYSRPKAQHYSLIASIVLQKSERIRFFCFFFLAFSLAKMKKNETPTVFSIFTCNHFIILLRRRDSVEGLTRDDALLYTICTALIQSNNMFL
jgi:hypothetical protein